MLLNSQILSDFIHLGHSVTFHNNSLNFIKVLDDTLYILFTIPKKIMSAPVFISTFHIEETVSQRSKATLPTLHCQACLTLES